MKKLKNKWITKNSATRLYELPAPIIGLTGGIATGKSTVAELFRNSGFAVIDADKLVKNIYQTNEAQQFVTFHFPEAIREGKIDFKHLRASVFGDVKNQELVENFIYSKLPAEFLRSFSEFNNPECVVYDVPLLFEKKLNFKVDVSVCVYSSKATQLERLIKRDHISADLAEKIISKQMDIEAKKNSSDLIIENIGDQANLQKKFAELLNILVL